MQIINIMTKWFIEEKNKKTYFREPAVLEPATHRLNDYY